MKLFRAKRSFIKALISLSFMCLAWVAGACGPKDQIAKDPIPKDQIAKDQVVDEGAVCYDFAPSGLRKICSDELTCCYSNPNSEDGSGVCVKISSLAISDAACGISANKCCAAGLRCRADSEGNGICAAQ